MIRSEDKDLLFFRNKFNRKEACVRVCDVNYL